MKYEELENLDSTIEVMREEVSYALMILDRAMSSCGVVGGGGTASSQDSGEQLSPSERERLTQLQASAYIQHFRLKSRLRLLLAERKQMEEQLRIAIPHFADPGAMLLYLRKKRDDLAERLRLAWKVLDQVDVHVRTLEALSGDLEEARLASSLAPSESEEKRLASLERACVEASASTEALPAVAATVARLEIMIKEMDERIKLFEAGYR